jgi:hypothetical protein
LTAFGTKLKAALRDWGWREGNSLLTFTLILLIYNVLRPIVNVKLVGAKTRSKYVHL